MILLAVESVQRLEQVQRVELVEFDYSHSMELFQPLVLLLVVASVAVLSPWQLVQGSQVLVRVEPFQ